LLVKNRHLLLAALWVSAMGCGGSVVTGTEGDAAVTNDLPVTTDVPPGLDGGAPVDNGPPPPVDAGQPDTRVPRCGDGILDPGESCDDGNNTSGDMCTAMCRFEARCGDGMVQRDRNEVCDDGNNFSGDGCRSDCGSNETCGNNIIDTAVGEVCDGTPGCAPGCRTLTLCGNGRVDMGEQCDDGNTTRWDGCGPDCRREQVLSMSRISIATTGQNVGCDFSGDGRPDNAFGEALGPSGGVINSFITSGVSNGQVLLQLGFLNLTDPVGQNLPNTRVGWLLGADADGDVTNNAVPGNPQRVQAGSLNPMTLLPQASFQSQAVMGQLRGGPEDIRLALGNGPLGNFNFRVLRGRISGLLVGDTTNNRITEMRNGVLCGAIPTRDLAALQNPAGMLPGGGGGGMASRSSFLELLVGGSGCWCSTSARSSPTSTSTATASSGTRPPWAAAAPRRRLRPASTATARASPAAPAPTTRAWPTGLARPSSSRRSGSPCAASRAAPPAAAA
jgi:cysteine-rich repeat protein